MPYGMPSGIGLRDEILRHGIDRAVHYRYHDDVQSQDSEFFRKRLAVVLNKLRFSGVESIDQFLEARDEDERDHGKLLLAAVLLDREQQGKKTLFDFAEIQSKLKLSGGHWLEHLFNRAAEGCNNDPTRLAATNDIHFVTFNYDTLIETFQRNVLEHRFKYPMPEDTASSHFPFPVYHVYGQIQSPIWGSQSEGRKPTIMPEHLSDSVEHPRYQR